MGLSGSKDSREPGDSPPPSRLPRGADVLVRATLAAIGYFGCARLGYLFASPRGIVTLWPASGFMLGLLLVSRLRDWPALIAGGLIGSGLSDTVSGNNISFVISAAFANGAESALAAGIVRWRLGHRVTLTTLREVWELTGTAGIFCNGVTALIGAAVLSHELALPFRRGWITWWVGDGLGMLIVAPLVIGAARATGWRGWRPLASIEAAVGLAVLIAVSALSLGTTSLGTLAPDSYVVLPLILWAALRFGPGGAALATATVAAVVMWNTGLGVGPIAGYTSSGVGAAVHVCVFLAVVSLTALVTSAVLEERKVAGLRHLESENRYRAVVDAATDAIITIDDRDRIRFANAAVERTFGYAPDELIGRDLTILMTPDDAARHKIGVAAYLATGRRHLEWRSVALTGRHRSGAPVFLEASFGDRIEGGNRVLTGVLRDITEQRAAQRALDDAEARMRFALEASRVGTWEVDLATGSARWSETLEALHGLAPGSFGGTLSAFLEQIHPEDRARAVDEFERATRQRTDSNLLYRATWPDGSVHWLSGVGRTFYDVDGNPIRAAGIALDVTERRSLEEQYRQSQKMDAIGQLAGGVAHDFNNLLTAIQGYGSMLAESLEPGSREREDVSEILAAADRAAALTRQLLAFSRKQVLAPRPLALADSLHSIEPMLRRLIGEHIEFVVRVADDAGQILADPGQVEQVVMNLCVNARDVMPNGGLLLVEVANIELDQAYERIHLAPPAGRYVVLSVTDTGTGMDAATVDRIFEPFFTTKPPGQGTGLGLSTVYGIVQQSGGSIKVYSEPGRGSTFKVYFPRIETVDEPAGPAVVAAPHRTGSEAVLVVEDEAALRKMAVRLLGAAGYSVTAAGTPKEALELAGSADGKFDLLITDVVLPEMNGRALAEALLERFPAIRILYMSGYTDDAIVRQGVLERGTYFIQKPFGQADLLRKVREVLDQPRG